MFARPLNDSQWANETMNLYGQDFQTASGMGDDKVRSALQNTLWFSYRKSFPYLADRAGRKFDSDAGAINR